MCQSYLNLVKGRCLNLALKLSFVLYTIDIMGLKEDVFITNTRKILLDRKKISEGLIKG